MLFLNKENKAVIEKFILTACTKTSTEAIGYLPLGCARDGGKLEHLALFQLHLKMSQACGSWKV